MPPVLDASHERGLLPCPYARQEASDESCAPRRPRCQRHPINDCPDPKHHSTEGLPKNRAAGLPCDQSARQGDGQGRNDGAGASSPGQGGCPASSTIYECLGTKTGATQQSIPILDCTQLFMLHAVLLLTVVLQVAAEPYETIAFRIPAREIEDEADDAGYWNWSHWDPDTKQYSFQFMFRLQPFA